MTCLQFQRTRFSDKNYRNYNSIKFMLHSNFKVSQRLLTPSVQVISSTKNRVRFRMNSETILGIDINILS
jgi:hypothetical protein